MIRPMNAPLIEIAALTVRYGAMTALDLLSLTIADHAITAIIGESGSGKSTLARAVAGLLPDGASLEGQVSWPALPHRPRLGSDIGFVFQEPYSSFDPVMSIGSQLIEIIKDKGADSRKNAAVRAVRLLQDMRIPQPQQAMAKYPHQFSGGQLQRIAIACAIARSPRLLIADEPTSALDMLVQQDIVALLQDLVAQRQMTLLFITHDIALASQIADHIAVFRQGRLVEAGPAARVLGAPQAEYTRALIAAVPRLEVRHG